MKGSIDLYRGNILDVDCDVIVNAANSSLMGGGGVDGAIHRAAGPELKEACRPLAPCPTGEVRVTEGFNIAPRLIFHTVRPVWRGGDQGEAELLKACYNHCLEALVKRDLTSIAFPAISTGVYGYPANEAAGIAVNTCRDFAKELDVKITLTAFDQKMATALEGALDQP
ncbi:MAG TPA: macro domain-containing protein [Henriciella marina]|uniref:macro domain-containing protein n=1 Tax=Henriciella sp. TaxID=1968823 RepID=UPI0017B18BD1|nr:macro domain-containing protein [Henriciella sp.]HIG23973.1 macro domain-containing protein [Henriciella sp.]HIK66044.1 macro domain-containing protein [Henriciella marina]